MARLGDLVQRCYDQLDHNPTLRAYRDRVVHALVGHYQRVSAGDPWRFLQTETTLQTYATVSGSASATISIGIGASNRRNVTGVGTAFGEHYEGHLFRGPDGNDYTIGNVENATSLYLSDPYDTTVAVTNSASWSIRFDRYATPADCEEVLGLTDRANDRGRLVYWDRRKEELDYLDRDTTGDPLIVIEDDWRRLRPPDSAPVVAGSTGGGTSNLVGGNVYDYCYTFIYEGMESPPSPVATVTLGGANDQVSVSALEDTRWQDTVSFQNLTTRKRKALYRRDVTNNGRWLRVALLADSATTFTDNHLLPDIAEDFDHAIELEDQNPRGSIRLWYTPDTDSSLELRYLRRPRQLYSNADEPEWPPAYHEILVYLTMFDLFSQVGEIGQAQLWERRAEGRLKDMRSRYLVAPDRHHVRRPWTRTIMRSRFYNYGTPTRT